MEVQIKLAELKMKISGIDEDIEVAIELRDFTEAQILNEKKALIESEIEEIRVTKIQKKKLQQSTTEQNESPEKSQIESFTQDSASKVLYHQLYLYETNIYLL